MLTSEEFIAELQGNVPVKQRLSDAGDDERQPRDVSFQLLSDSREQLEEAVKHARMFAYTLHRPIAEQQRGSDGSARYSAHLWTNTVTVLPILMRHCAVMLAIADAFGCQFNGWDAKVIRTGGAASGGGSGESDPAALTDTASRDHTRPVPSRQSRSF